jgi:hypothetical protein
MPEADIEFLEIEMELVRTIRRGKRLHLVASALRRETEIVAELARLRGEANVLPMAANFVRRAEEPESGGAQ